MRHIGSIVLSVISAAIMYVLMGVGMVKFGTNGGAVLAGQSTDWKAVGIGTGALVIVGALWAILAMVRISPLGPLVAGLLFVGVQVWSLLNESNLISTLGSSVMGIKGAAEAPLNGPMLVMAVAMIATIFSGRRWRGTDKPATATGYPAYNAGPSYPEPTSAAPTYTAPGTSPYPAPSYPTADPTTYVPAVPEPTSPIEGMPIEGMPTQTVPETAADSGAGTDTQVTTEQ